MTARRPELAALEGEKRRAIRGDRKITAGCGGGEGRLLRKERFSCRRVSASGKCNAHKVTAPGHAPMQQDTVLCAELPFSYAVRRSSLSTPAWRAGDRPVSAFYACPLAGRRQGPPLDTFPSQTPPQDAAVDG
jgi:hypothetical protein